MPKLKPIVIDVNGNTADVKAKLDNLKTQVGGLESTFKRPTRSVGGLNKGLRKLIPALGAAAAGAWGLSMALNIFKNSVSAAAQIERLEIAFGAMAGGAERGKKMVDELRRLALRTGVELGAMAGVVRKFLALGFSPDDAMTLQKSLLDVGRTVGLTSQEIGLLGVAIAQVKAKGKANMEELRQQIGEKGVPIFDVLAKKMGVGRAELDKMIQEGKVGSDDVINIFKNLEGAFGRFAGGADLMASTFSGTMDRIKSVMMEAFRAIGRPIIEAMQPLLKEVFDFLKNSLPLAEALGERLAKGITKARVVLTTLISMFKNGVLGEFVYSGLKLAFMKAVNILVGLLMSAVNIFIITLANSLKLLTNFNFLKSAILSIPAFQMVFVGVAKNFVKVLLDGVSDMRDTLVATMRFAKNDMFGLAESVKAGHEARVARRKASVSKLRDGPNSSTYRNLNTLANQAEGRAAAAKMNLDATYSDFLTATKSEFAALFKGAFDLDKNGDDMIKEGMGILEKEIPAMAQMWKATVLDPAIEELKKFKPAAIFNTEEEQAEFDSLWNRYVTSFKEKIRKIKMGKDNPFSPLTDSDPGGAGGAGGKGSGFTSIGDALARVGGGGGFYAGRNSMLQVQQQQLVAQTRTNAILQAIYDREGLTLTVN